MSLITSIITGGKELELSSGSKVLVDADDFEFLKRWSWKESKGRACRNIHLATVGNWKDGKRKDKTLFMRRVIMDAPENKVVDHINGNVLDNRKSNLRICDQVENRRNNKKYSSNTHGYKGVYLDKRCGRYYAQIRFMNKSYALGNFDDPKEAALEYDHVAKQLFGKYANLNFKGNK